LPSLAILSFSAFDMGLLLTILMGDSGYRWESRNRQGGGMSLMGGGFN
jgi:hypothetical protein